MADEDEGQDMGSTFLKNHMTEAQNALPSMEQGGFADAPRRKLRDASDGALINHYGKEAGGGGDDDEPYSEPTVNRSRKGDKAPGSVGGTKDKAIKVLR
jgi:hypothetical protein